jgi:predicted HNH restriction endonuclease
MKSEIRLTEAFRLTASSFGQEGFTTKDFVDRYQAQSPDEWSALIGRYGPGGKGSGHHYSANSRVGSMLVVLFRAGDLHRFPYVSAPPDWGNPWIRRWAVSVRSALADELAVLGPANPDIDNKNLPPWVDREYREGTPQLRAHLVRERDSRLSGDKKVEFRATHGRLFCERCKLAPIEVYGEDFGEAAIEVHHATTLVSDMKPNHRPKLSDLQCLCANCHRVVHAELRAGKRQTIA